MLVWSMFGGTDGSAGTGMEHVVCILSIWEVFLTAMEYVVCLSGKGEGRGEGEGIEGKRDGE